MLTIVKYDPINFDFSVKFYQIYPRSRNFLEFMCKMASSGVLLTLALDHMNSTKFLLPK